jgi:hypothetical protein
MLTRLHEVVRIKWRELSTNDWILHHDSAPAHKALSVKHFRPQKSITEVEHTPYAPDLAPNDFWLFTQIKSALKRRRFRDTEDIQKSDDVTESYSTTEVPKMFPTMATSLG